MAEQVIVFDLSELDMLEAFGPDTRRWLNGMITANVRDLVVGGVRRSALTDVKGRLEGLLFVACVDEDRFVLVGEGIEGRALFDRLDRYLIMDEVELEPRDHRVISVQGPGAEAAVDALEPAWLARAARDRSGLGGVDLLVLGDAAARLLAALPDPAPPERLEVLRVLAGHPRWPVDMDHKTFVHELGLVEELCSFEKGCYIGQEVINRMQVMGKANRRLLRVALEAPLTGEVVLEERAVGQVTSAVGTPEGARGLGLLRRQAWEPGTRLVVRGEAGETVATVLG